MLEDNKLLDILSTLVLKLGVENQLKEAAEKSALPTLDLCKLDMNRGANPL